MLPDEGLREVLTSHAAARHLAAIATVPIVIDVPAEPGIAHIRLDQLAHTFLGGARRASRARVMIWAWASLAPTPDTHPSSWCGDVVELIADWLSMHTLHTLADGSAFSVIPEGAPRPAKDTTRGADHPVWGSGIEVTMSIRHAVPRLTP